MHMSSVQAEFDALTANGAQDAQDFRARVDALLDRTIQLPTKAGYAHDEPSDLDNIRAGRPDGPRRLKLPGTEETLADKIHGAWLGRCCGCLPGKPVEGARSHQIHSIVESAGKDFITDYLWRMGPTQKACEEAGRAGLLEFGAHVAHMVRDDDTDYTIVGMTIMKQKGMHFQPGDMAAHWMWNMPMLATSTAERVAYRNFANQIAPPQSATMRNPWCNHDRNWLKLIVATQRYCHRLFRDGAWTPYLPDQPTGVCAHSWELASERLVTLVNRSREPRAVNVSQYSETLLPCWDLLRGCKMNKGKEMVIPAEGYGALLFGGEPSREFLDQQCRLWSTSSWGRRARVHRKHSFPIGRLR